MVTEKLQGIFLFACGLISLNSSRNPEEFFFAITKLIRVYFVSGL
ncbi:MAG: hypothetical protein AVDCRST_MAG95-567 [uncultured Adhaeribacter sp.]|uniref:Uncharacterized protein n=1 Tax=uncultured Adhaeribacter sp. TaxID=448109 RepID=A0A6J4HEN4_9BACT|nr:MAG: hypothetical protein AVDCRST_MAG95-567 [uncultured Adhaeribacter sp.]